MAGVKAEEFRGRGVEMLYAADDILDMREKMEGGKRDQKHDRGLGWHEGDREKKKWVCGVLNCRREIKVFST